MKQLLSIFIALAFITPNIQAQEENEVLIGLLKEEVELVVASGIAKDQIAPTLNQIAGFLNAQDEQGHKVSEGIGAIVHGYLEIEKTRDDQGKKIEYVIKRDEQDNIVLREKLLPTTSKQRKILSRLWSSITQYEEITGLSRMTVYQSIGLIPTPKKQISATADYQGGGVSSVTRPAQIEQTHPAYIFQNEEINDYTLDDCKQTSLIYAVKNIDRPTWTFAERLSDILWHDNEACTFHYPVSLDEDEASIFEPLFKCFQLHKMSNSNMDSYHDFMNFIIPENLTPTEATID